MRHEPDIQQWPAQEPSLDFADRTVTAILAADVSSGDASDGFVSARDGAGQGAFGSGRVLRWPGLFVLAAALVAATAWGSGVLTGPTPQAEPPEQSTEPATASPKVDAKAAFARDHSRPARVEAPEPPAVRRWSPTLPPQPAVAIEIEDEPPRFVPVPRCQCQADGLICSCYND